MGNNKGGTLAQSAGNPSVTPVQVIEFWDLVPALSIQTNRPLVSAIRFSNKWGDLITI